jgi:hypothetical protein
MEGHTPKTVKASRTPQKTDLFFNFFAAGINKKLTVMI